MDSMVFKYLVWTGVAYGIQIGFACLQLALCAWLLASGYFMLVPAKKDHSRLKFLGVLIPDERNEQLGAFMVSLGGGLLLPLVFAPYWLSIVASVVTLGLLLTIDKQIGINTGTIARKVLAGCAVIVIGLTAWEGRDLVVAAKDAAVKAAYWRIYEKGLQAEYDPQAPKAGDEAPDFEVSDITGTKTVRLTEMQGKPVAIIFGSHT